MIRIGLLGASRIAPKAVIDTAAARDDVTIQAIAASSQDKAQAYADKHGIPVALGGYAELAARDDVDVIYCGLPPSAHLETSLQGLAAGKMLLVEKPFAMNAAEAQQIADAVTNKPALEAFHYRFHSQIVRAIDLLRSGAIGDIQRIDGLFHAEIKKGGGEYRWIKALGGGGVMDLGCYVIHACRSLMGSEPTVVSASATWEDGVDVDMEAILDFGGVPGRIECSMAKPRFAVLTVQGSAGTLELGNFVAPHVGGELRLTRGGETTVEAATGPTTYAAQLDHAVTVWRGEAAPITGGADAVANMAVIDACKRLAGG